VSRSLCWRRRKKNITTLSTPYIQTFLGEGRDWNRGRGTQKNAPYQKGSEEGDLVRVDETSLSALAYREEKGKHGGPLKIKLVGPGLFTFSCWG